MTSKSTTLRISIDKELAEALKIASKRYPGLKPTQLIRMGFFSFLDTNQQTKPSQNITEILNDIYGSETTCNFKTQDEFQEWWMKNKNEIRS